MAKITLQGNVCNTCGELPGKGAQAPDFRLTDGKLSDHGLDNYSGKKKVLNIFPSMDTPTCAMSVKKFNDHAKENTDVVMLMVSADLPFAQGRFCGDNGLDNVKSLSMMRDKSFAEDYGILITDGPLAGVSGRAVVVLDENNTVLHSELVSEIADEPNYEAALNALNA